MSETHEVLGEDICDNYFGEETRVVCRDDSYDDNVSRSNIMEETVSGPVEEREGVDETQEALKLLFSWELKDDLVVMLMGLGFDRVTSLKLLASKEVVKDIDGLSFAEKALLTQRCQAWLRALESQGTPNKDSPPHSSTSSWSSSSTVLVSPSQ